MRLGIRSLEGLLTGVRGRLESGDLGSRPHAFTTWNVVPLSLPLLALRARGGAGALMVGLRPGRHWHTLQVYDMEKVTVRFRASSSS